MSKYFVGAILVLFFQGCIQADQSKLINEKAFAEQYFDQDAEWYRQSIPFFECSDKTLEQVYYYRWKLYKAHIRKVGKDRYVITEFINHVPWDRDPFCTINAASMHHIYEGRWLRDDRYVNGYIDYLFHDGGNNRHYSESIADAAYANYLVNADKGFLVQQLDSMILMYNEWSDHYDSSKNLYWIPAMPDATEYTIASVDASGGKGGFDDGEAYRPTINSYMYGNAKAISRIAAMKGDSTTARKFMERAMHLKLFVEKDLWNDSLQHFTDRFRVNNEYVHYWNFIRGRELAGIIPWYFELPADSPVYSAAWKHIADTSQLLGQFGFRTNEPSYQYYFKQFVFFQGQRGSQWNGPSWPYQSSQALTAMANLLNDYHQTEISASDYVKMLRQFAKQHYLPNGKLDLVENYDPNIGGPIVYYYWSNHYNHSSFNNLIISGLCGLRPSESDTLELNPLLDESIQYYCLQDVSYHGHRLTVVSDRNGDKYKLGKGLTVFVDGKKSSIDKSNGKFFVNIGPVIIKKPTDEPVNYALNISKQGYPKLCASVNQVPDSIYQANDGRVWYFPEITNRWTTQGSNSSNDWWEVDFGQTRNISTVNLFLFADDKEFAIPDRIDIQYFHDGKWQPISLKSPGNLVGNTKNILIFEKVPAEKLKINFQHKKNVAVVEVECF